MKILYVVDYYQPQLGYSEYFIPNELKKKGHTVTILTSNYYYPFPNYEETSGKILGPRRQTPGTFKKDGITIIKEPLVAEIFTRAIIKNHENVVKKYKPDYVIVNKSAGWNVIRMAQLKDKYGFSLLSYDAHLPSGFIAVGNIYAKSVFYWIFRLLFAGLLNSKVDKFVAVQEDTEIIMRKYYGQDDIVHIPLGTDTDRFRKDAKQGEKIRKELGINRTDFVTIYTGKVIKTKGVDILFAALNILFNKGYDLSLIVVGNGDSEYVNFCFSRLEKKYHKHIKMVGFKDNSELYKYYSAATVGVWPLEESTAMNDAAACQLPFIANDKIGALVRLSNNNALTYKQHDYKDLARKIEKLIKDKKLTKKMGLNGKDLIDTKLSWSKIVDEYLQYAD